MQLDPPQRSFHEEGMEAIIALCLNWSKLNPFNLLQEPLLQKFSADTENGRSVQTSFQIVLD